MIFHGIAVKPGKPTAFALVGPARRFSACPATRRRASRTRTSCSCRSCARPRACRLRAADRPRRRSADASSRRPAAISSTRSAARRRGVAGVQGIGRHHQPVAGRRLHRDSRRSEHGRRRGARRRHALLTLVTESGNLVGKLAIGRCVDSRDHPMTIAMTRFYRRPIRRSYSCSRTSAVCRSKPPPCACRRRGIRVAAIADGQILQPSVDDQIDQRGGAENAVGDQIAARTSRTRALIERADDHDGQTRSWDRNPCGCRSRRREHTGQRSTACHRRTASRHDRAARRGRSRRT